MDGVLSNCEEVDKLIEVKKKRSTYFSLNRMFMMFNWSITTSKHTNMVNTLPTNMVNKITSSLISKNYQNVLTTSIVPMIVKKPFSAFCSLSSHPSSLQVDLMSLIFSLPPYTSSWFETKVPSNVNRTGAVSALPMPMPLSLAGVVSLSDVATGLERGASGLTFVFFGLPLGLGGSPSVTGASIVIVGVFLGLPLGLGGSPSVAGALVVAIGVFLGLPLRLGIALEVPASLHGPAATESYNIK
ncbi:hypothetical protein H5410_042134 [Solanum commersonii]|uniref:Uncharacterized protein n=1 Tax=Solanum commersonii TaxID=4109 RepID=A0A9J5XWN9_SOLCO|nr:hypothetical protein H5410_042134 [Solanum commersonii]